MQQQQQQQQQQHQQQQQKHHNHASFSFIGCLLLHALQRKRVLDPAPHVRMSGRNRKQAARVGVARAIVNVVLARCTVGEDLQAPVLEFEGCAVGGRGLGCGRRGIDQAHKWQPQPPTIWLSGCSPH